MKTFRFDFSGGINNVGDKGIIENKYLSFADNVDLRSGSIRPIKGPSFHMAGLAGGLRLWEHKGVFYQSNRWRDYAAVSAENTTIIYYSEDGVAPRKKVGNIDVPLGVPAPKTAPAAVTSSALCPIVQVVQSSGGALTAGTVRFYRISVETDKGIQPPSASLGIVLAGTYTKNTVIKLPSGGTLTLPKDSPRIDLAVQVSWSPVQDAIKYHIFAGPAGQEKLIATVAANVYTYKDAGITSGDGELASRYVSGQPYRYFTTFVRKVGPTVNESGPSPISPEITSKFGRRLTFSLESDGFFSQEGVTTLTPTASTTTAACGWEWEIDTVERAAILNHIKVTLKTAVSLPSIDVTATFTGTSNIAWDNQEHILTTDLLNNKVVYIKNVSLLDSVPAGAKMVLNAAKFTVPGHGLIVNDPVALTIGGSVVSAKVIAVADDVVTFDARLLTGLTVSSVKAVPGSYIQFRNIYRTTTSGGFQLVTQLPVNIQLYEDEITEAELGDPPTSYYVEGGIPVIYAMPPVGLKGLTEHYGMLFGIDGRRVRWTPIGAPDAWPDNFYQEGFGSAPLALASFSQSLIVLCEDALYRIDGNRPLDMSLTRTLAEDGCIAPHAVLKTSDAGLLYVSRRGVMAFDGMHARCLTDNKLRSNVWNSTSKDHVGAYRIPPMIPPLLSWNYAAMLENENVLSSVKEANGNFGNVESPYLQNNLRAFCHRGKAYFFWNDYEMGSGGEGLTEMHTCIVIDLASPGMPITTMAIKARDVAVNAKEEVFALFDNILNVVEW